MKDVTKKKKGRANVSGIDLDVFDRCKRAARPFGITKDAQVVRFVLEQWAAGRTIADVAPGAL
jgi:hypothetical protein